MRRGLTYGLVWVAAAATAGLVFLPVVDHLFGGTGFLSVTCRLAFSRVCHQDPARSLVIAGALLPVCARCTGIYLGFLAGWSVRVFRRGPDRDRRLPVGLFLSGLTPLVIDGALNWAGLVATPPLARLFTGLMFGFFAARALWPELLPALENLRLRPARFRPAVGR